MQETFDDILKAQVIYKKMIACADTPAFKKAFSEAIGTHTLDEFYPVVVRAELSAILFLSAAAQKTSSVFDFETHVRKTYGLQPHHLIGLGTQTVADIMEENLPAVEAMLFALGYGVESGKIAHFGLGDTGGKVVRFSAERRAAG